MAITEAPAPSKGLASFDYKINRFKGNTDQSNNLCVPTFYMKGQHDKAVTPAESSSKTAGKIKAGTYDVLISIAISDQTQKVWLENFTMKPDVNYAISTNLNGGVIVYTGGNKDIKNMHLYPSGTSVKQTGNPAPIKNLELGNYSNITSASACPPGAYDILLAYGNGNKYEWKKNLVVKTGSRTEVK